MARWKLREKHYLKVPGNEWEYQETAQSGKTGRKRYEVPMFLNPDDPADYNYPDGIIVGYTPHDRDIIFVGPPTPDMEPLDDEAKKLSAEEARKWKHPIESLPGDFSQSLLTDLQRQIDQLATGESKKPVVVKGVDPEDFKAMQEQLATLMAQNAELMAEQKKARRV